MGTTGGPVVIVGCGKRKQPVPTAIADLYTGTYQRRAVAWARSLTAVRLFVLSTAYGLVPGDTVVAPYEATLASSRYAQSSALPTHPTISPLKVRAQVLTANISGPVVLLAGASYAALLNEAAGDRLTPFNPFADEAVRRGWDRRNGYQCKLMAEYMGRMPP
jgi:hypothetical protein